MKERITITIGTDLLEKIDNEVDGSTIKNRSHAIELLLSKSLTRRSITSALILAGGPTEIEVDRKMIHTPMLMVNKRPLIEHQVRLLKRQGVKNIVISIGYKKDDIMQHFGDGEEFGVHISYVEEEEPLGTAGALKKASEYFNNTFIVCNADELKKIEISEMLAFHRKQGSHATIALTTVNDATNYGVVLLNGNRVYQFIEKPTGNIPSNLINAGFYIFEPEILKEIPDGYSKIEEDLFPKLAARNDLCGYVFYGAWEDIRSTQAYETAEEKWEDF